MASVHTVRFSHRSPIQMNWLKLNCHRTLTSQKSCIDSHTSSPLMEGQYLIMTIFNAPATLALRRKHHLDRRRGVSYPFVFSDSGQVPTMAIRGDFQQWVFKQRRFARAWLSFTTACRTRLLSFITTPPVTFARWCRPSCAI